ncbi:MAG TPA: serine/threonine-protein kinase [Usitatibacteraceae bacterium]|nr:serine/threonine-protein kinase [Usitatibacteraceae bacterium]
MSATIPGQFGRFRVLEELGRGAMGVVYRAQDPALGRTVAIKTITLTGTDEERAQFEARFMQEARAAGGIGHPSIITIYDVGREGDVAFMAMELLDGQELRDLIRGGSLAPSEAVEIAAQVAEALSAAHERGVIHRDVKPGNIMVLSDGRVKIMDFGIARLREPAVKTATGMMLGSPRYMAPEQVSGQAFDHRADIFSLGVVLYEMLTGITPFAGGDLTQLMFQVVNAAVVPPSHVNRTLPPVLDYILARALKKNPDERYGSAAELATDLRDSIADVLEAEAAVRARTDASGTGTVPDLPGWGTAQRGAPSVDRGDEVVELRPSPRFDCVEGLARLAVLPVDSDATRSRAGYTLPAGTKPQRAPWRSDLPFVLVVAGYLAATVVAVIIVLR